MEQNDPWAIIPATPYRSASTPKHRRRSPRAVTGLAVLSAVMMAVLFAGGIQLYRLGHGLLAIPHPVAAHQRVSPAAITAPPPPAPTPAATGAHHWHRDHYHRQLAAEVPVPIPAPPVPLITSTPRPSRRPPSPTPTPSSPTPTTPVPTTPAPTPTFSSPSPQPSVTGSPSFQEQ